MSYHIKKLFGILVIAIFACPTFADEPSPMELSTPSAKIFDLSLTKDPERPRSYFWPQLISFGLPGFDQWIEGQYSQASFYSGLGVAAAYLQTEAAEEPKSSKFRREHQKFSVQLYLTSGALSAYSSFRSAVRTRKTEGKFKFLKHEESADDILAAPFRFSYLKRPTTYIPLALASGYVLAVALSSDKSWALSGEEAAYGTATSYMAGTWEEAVFRGWLMPVQMEAFDSEFWSNTSTAVIFAALHISSENKYGIFQFVAGWYFGRVVQKNDWRIGEATFQHFWYDALVFNGLVYALNGRNGTFRIPAVTIPF